MFVDDLGVEIAKREGLIDPLPKDKMPNLAKVYPRFIYNDGYGVALAVSSAGIFYNTRDDSAARELRRHVGSEV